MTRFKLFNTYFWIIYTVVLVFSTYAIFETNTEHIVEFINLVALLLIAWCSYVLGKQMESSNSYKSKLDSLTGIPNRAGVYEILDKTINSKSNLGLALLFIDLDQFKEINDSFGHTVGDTLLQICATRMRNCIRVGDTVGRLGGDEFIVILPDVNNKEDAGNISQVLVDSIAGAYSIDGYKLYVSASIGVVLYPYDATDISCLFKSADHAMYSAKKNGRNRYEHYDLEMKAESDKSSQLARDLHQAIDQNELYLMYQPIVNIETGSVQKAEALIRWAHPTLGLISPSVFIALAEKNGLIIPIGDWVFKTAIRQCALWRQSYPDFRMSINVAAAQIHKLDIHTWLAYMSKIGISASALTVELTESALVSRPETVIKKLEQLRSAGVHIALDDFGTGYSSLSYLRNFNIDILKIDQSFIRNLSDNPMDIVICTSLIELSHNLGIRVVAEGVEHSENLRDLSRMKCDYAQGYLFARPLSAENFEKFTNMKYNTPTNTVN